MRVSTLIAATALVATAPAAARTIVIVNDDGLTSNTLALYKALKAKGHDVIVSVPCQNQSGMGAALRLGGGIGPLEKDCRSGAAKAGAPGAGPMTRDGIDARDFYYVDATPVVALFYGLDVLAQKRWGKAPDVVLSGPNEGQNVGSSLQSSGTVSAAQAAAARGLPAIALSAGFATADDAGLANPDSPKVAALSATLVDYLDTAAKGGPILPAGVSLNVNFPNALDHPAWRIAHVGTYNSATIRFVENMAAAGAALPGSASKPLQPLPGLSITPNPEPPSADQQDDASVVIKTAIAITPMQTGVGSPANERWMADLMKRIPLK